MFMSAQKKALHPRRVMLRRILMLAVMGAIHQVFHPGEALLLYAIVALFLLLPVSFLPRRLLATWGIPLGLMLLIVGGLYGGIAEIPGAFLLGYALASADLPRRWDHVGSRVLAVLGGLVVASGLMVYKQSTLGVEELFSPLVSLTGLVLATTYCTLTIALMSTSARTLLIKMFSPLGRMALTNYITATALFHAAKLLPFVEQNTNTAVKDRFWLMLMGLVIVMLALQAIISAWWLRHHSYGPLEKLWRLATWKGEPSTPQFDQTPAEKSEAS